MPGRDFKLRAYLNPQTRVVHLGFDRAPDENYPDAFSFCGKVVATLSDAAQDDEAAARLNQLHQAIVKGGIDATIRRLYPTVKRERIDDVLLRLETLVEATLASPEMRSWGMLDLGLATTATVPSLAGAKLCGACARSPFARSVRLKRPGEDA
jgi:hypothetical protein